MGTTFNWNGGSFPGPTQGEKGWAQQQIALLQSITQNAVTKTTVQTLTNKTIKFADGEATAPSITFNSDDATGLYLIGGSQLGLVTDGALRVELDATGNVIVVGTDNNLQLAGSATGDPVTAVAAGTDTDIDIALVPKGAGIVDVDGGVEADSFTATGAVTGATLVANADNDLTIAGGTAGNPVTATATGSDTDVGIILATKGAGSLLLKIGAATVLTLATAAITAALPLAMGTNKITGLGDPTAAQDAATKGYIDQYQINKNRIINGAMNIDQRNAGGAITCNGSGPFFPVDRWLATGTAADGVFTVEQSQTSAPAGFPNFLRATVTTADASVTAAQVYAIGQNIEGYNVIDLGFGLSTASTVTLSFWVRSSLSGQFGGALRNAGFNRSYPFSYTINAINTWEQKSVTIAGDTTGTWLITNGVGVTVWFDMGSGSNLTGTAGSWQASNLVGATGDTKVISTLSATWDITGVQFEKGSIATPFEWRQFLAEVMLCQRYFCKTFDLGVAVGFNAGVAGALTCISINGIAAGDNFTFPVTMRTPPTMSRYNAGNTGNGTDWWNISTSGNIASNAFTAIGTRNAGTASNGTVGVSNNFFVLHATADAEF